MPNIDFNRLEENYQGVLASRSKGAIDFDALERNFQAEYPEVGPVGAAYKGFRESILMGYGVPERIKKERLEEGFGTKAAYAAGSIVGMLPSFVSLGGAVARIPTIAKMFRAIQGLQRAGKAVPLMMKLKATIPHSMATFAAHSALSRPPEGGIDITGRTKRGMRGAIVGGIPFGVAGVVPGRTAGALAAGAAGGVGAVVAGEKPEEIMTSSGLLAALSYLMHGKYARGLETVKTKDTKESPKEVAGKIQEELGSLPKEQRTAVAEDFAALGTQAAALRTAEDRQAEIERQFPTESEVAELEAARKKYGVRAPTFDEAAYRQRKYAITEVGERLPVRVGAETEEIPEGEILPSALLPYPEGRGPGFEFRDVEERAPLPKKEIKLPPAEKPMRSKRMADTDAKAVKAKHFVDWVQARSGMWDESLPGEMTEFNVQNSKVIGLVSKKKGQPMDELLAQAKADEWLPADAQLSDMFNLLRKDIVGRHTKGERVMRMTDERTETKLGEELAKQEAEFADNEFMEYIARNPKERELYENLTRDQKALIDEIRAEEGIEAQSIRAVEVDTQREVVSEIEKQGDRFTPNERQTALDEVSAFFEEKAKPAKEPTEAKPTPREAFKQAVDILQKAPRGFEMPPPGTYGLVFHKGRQIPFKFHREIKSGKNTGKRQIILPDGKKITVVKEDVLRYPGEAEGMIADFLGLQTVYEKLVGAIESGKREKVREKIDEYRKTFLEPVKGNPLDRPAVKFLQTEKLSDYLAAMPKMGDLKPNELFRLDPEAKEMIAQYLTKGGNLKPGVRQSGFHALKEFDDAFTGPPVLDPKTGESAVYKKGPLEGQVIRQKVPDISKTVAMTSDPTRMIQAIDQGKWGGAAQKHILWPSRMNRLAELRWLDMQKDRIAKVKEKYNVDSGKKEKACGDIIEFISGNKAWKWETESVLNISQIKKLLEPFKPEVRTELVQATMESRRLFHNWRDNQNAARKLRKQPEIPYRSFYRPWIMERNLWSKLFGMKRRPKEIMERPEMPDFIFPDRRFNPRAEARTGLLAKYPKERRLFRLLSDYAETAAKDIFETNTVHNNKIHAAILEGRGLPNAAAAIKSWTAETFAGVKPRISRAVAETLPVPIRAGIRTIRRMLTRAVFPLNWTWNFFIQTSSAGITYVRYGAASNIAGLKYFYNRGIRQGIKQNAYSSIVKSRWGGQAAYQDVQGSILKNRRLDTRPIDKVEDYANFLTRSFEDGLTGHAVAAAYHYGRTKLKLKGRELWEFASEGGAKTQSMYNFGDVPGLLRAREVGQVGPFQTFAFEVFNTIREMNIPVLRRVIGKTGLYETMSADSVAGKALMSNRLKMLAKWVVAITLTNAVVERAIGRKPWVPSSFVPFLGYLVGGYAGRPIAPKAYIDDLRKGIRDVIANEDFRKLRKWALRYHMLAGIQLNRMLEGFEAVAKREVEDVSGRRMYRVKGIVEKAKAITMGPARTAAGKEYYKKHTEKKGIIGAIRQRLEGGRKLPRRRVGLGR